MNSIINTRKGVCYWCGRVGTTECHHIFRGKNRKRADADGLVVHLCHFCHNEPPHGVHYNKALDIHLKRMGQRLWMARYDKTVEDFIMAYGRNYLD